MSRGRWLTSKEAAALLRVHPKHIYRLLRRGLPAQRVGGQWRFRADEIEQWARGRRDTEQKGNKNLQKGTSSEDRTALLLGSDDVAVAALVNEVNRRGPPALGWLPHGRAGTERWLQTNRALAAAVLGEPPTTPDLQLAWIHIAHEQFGVIAGPGEPPPEPVSMLQRRVRVASWLPGSDLRSVVDSVLAREGVEPNTAHASAMLATSHADIVAAVVRGEAQVGITTASWAARFGLPFRPLGSRPLGLVASASALGHPLLVRCWEVLQSNTFRQALEQAGGFDTSAAGAIRYLRPDTPVLPPAEDISSSHATAKWMVVVRERGQDISERLLRVASHLRNQGIVVGGYAQVPKRTNARVSGYDLRRLSRKQRLVLARRRAPAGSGPVLSYRAYQFREEAFAKARSWLEQDASRADLLVLDGVSSREAEGMGHFGALAWASRLRGPKLVVACIRRDRLGAVVDKLGIRDRVAQVLEAPTDTSSEDSLVTTLAAAVRTEESNE